MLIVYSFYSKFYLPKKPPCSNKKANKINDKRSSNITTKP